jgi:hypothetical protein
MGADNLFTTYELFTTEFKKAWGEVDSAAQARNKLHMLRCGGPRGYGVTAHITSFEDIINRTGITDEPTKISFFHEGIQYN